MLKKLITLCICFCAIGLQAAPLIVGINAEFPPFCFIEDRKIIGFDIDVASEIAKRMGRELELKDMPFDALIPEVILGRVDLVTGGMSYTEERAKRVLFTKTYLDADPLVVFSMAKTPVSFDLIKGKNIVVVEGFTADQLMSTKKDINLLRLSNQADAFMALKCGRADALVTAKSTINTFFDKHDSTLYHSDIIEGTNETCAIIVPKSKPEILSEAQKMLDAMEADGTLSTLKAKWKLR